MTRRRRVIEGQGDLFAAGEVFPVRRPVENARPVDLSLRIKTGMSQALKECPDSAAIVAARIAEMTGREMSVDALYSYTAASKPEHDIGIVRFVAFVRATRAYWLWDLLVEDDGLMVLQGREAKLAQLGHGRRAGPGKRPGAGLAGRRDRELDCRPPRLRRRGDPANAVVETSPAPAPDLTLAMRRASVAVAQDAAIGTAVAEALARSAPVFNTHSQALAGRLIAEERALKEIVADIDARIAELNAQRTDAMLAESGIARALEALQRGAA